MHSKMPGPLQDSACSADELGGESEEIDIDGDSQHAVPAFVREDREAGSAEGKGGITDSYNAISEGVIGSNGLDLQEGAAVVDRIKVTVGADFDADEAVAAGGTRVEVSVKPGCKGDNKEEVMVAAPGACIDAHVVGYVCGGENERGKRSVCVCVCVCVRVRVCVFI